MKTKPKTLVIDGQIVSVGDRIKFIIPGSKAKIYLVWEVDPVLELIGVNCRVLGKIRWVKKSEVVKHIKN